MSTDQYNRQEAKYAVVDLGVDNAGAGNGYTAKLPQGALVVSAGLVTVTAFDGTGTVTGTITDGTTALVNAQDVKTTGIETVAVAQKFYPTGGTITFSLADANSDSAAGRAIGYVSYVQLGNGCSIQE
jgi:hypothetical protein